MHAVSTCICFILCYLHRNNVICNKFIYCLHGFVCILMPKGLREKIGFWQLVDSTQCFELLSQDTWYHPLTENQRFQTFFSETDHLITTDEVRKWYVSKLAATSGISDWVLRAIARGNVWHGKMLHNFGMEFPQRYDPRLIWQLENSEKCLLPNSVWPTTHSKTSGMPFSLHWGSPKSLNSTYRTAGFKPSDPRHSHTSK